MAPARPEEADPEPRYRAPEFPLMVLPDPTEKVPLSPNDELPVLNIIDPLTPEEPEFDVLNKKLPEDVAEPVPVMILTRPPLADDDKPAEMTTSPPTALFPAPTVT